MPYINVKLAGNLNKDQKSDTDFKPYGVDVDSKSSDE